MLDTKVSDETPTTDIGIRECEDLVHPLTGELIPSTDLPAVVDAITQIRDHRDSLNVVLGYFNDAVKAESKRQGSKTLHIHGHKLTVSPETETEWDVEVLAELLVVGLPVERYNELVTEEVTYKVNGNVARQIEGASDEYAAVIRRARSKVPVRQYVTVK